MSGVSRRGWLRGLVPHVAGAAAEVVESKLTRALRPQRRPPGAVAEPLFMELCDGCDECVKACEPAAIHVFTNEAGPELAGTPVMRPQDRPCLMCEGFPCVTACTRGALEQPPAPIWRLGRARIVRDKCFAFKGPECGACVGLCPSDIGAITLAAWKPQLDDELCIGCGICIDACPTIPAAIEMVPVGER